MSSRAAAALFICLGASAWGVGTSIRIPEFLRRRGRRVNPLQLRQMILTYVDEYRWITRQELGRPGLLYRHCLTSGLAALAAAVYAVLTTGSG